MTTQFYNNLHVSINSDDLFDQLSQNTEETIKIAAATIAQIDLLNVETSKRKNVEKLLKGSFEDQTLALELIKEEAPWAGKIFEVTKLGYSEMNKIVYILKEYYKEVLY